ncbi:MAG: threonine aldolase family protein [Solirubrobacteraceae bacterium]
MSSPKRGFGSDNAAAVHPRVLDAIAAANHGHAPGYGHDPLTERVQLRFKELFGERSETFFVWGGTAANVLSLRAACRPWHAVICAETAHLNVDEGGAPEAIAGIKLLAAGTEDGKLTVDSVSPLITRIGDEHAVQPRVLSISQATELGTVYTADELSALAELAHRNDMLLQLDGARISNAAAALGVSPAALSAEVGVDLLSFGGTKNGLLGAEAIVVLAPELAPSLPYLRKQSMQLASKMRFLAAQFDALLTDDLWLTLASNANAMAARLHDAVRDLPGLTITRPVQANAVFAKIPRGATAELQRETHFYVWDEATGEVRWMCAWDTTPDDVDAFAAAIASALASA